MVEDDNLCCSGLHKKFEGPVQGKMAKFQKICLIQVNFICYATHQLDPVL